MKNNALQNFLKIRIIIVYLILLTTGFILFDKRWSIVIGLTCGSIFGILKFIGASRFMSGILVQGEKLFYLRRTLVKFLSLQMATVFLLAVSICISLWFFSGVVAGILLIPVIILINSLTEVLGLSHNNFQ